MDINIGILRETFLSELNIKFTKFECSGKSNIEYQKYPIANREEWRRSNNEFSSNKNKLVLDGLCWMGCLCNPINSKHGWISYYKCENGWDLKHIMATIRHNYLWGSTACYFTKNKWSAGVNTANKIEELWITNPMNFENQIAEAAYVSDIYITIVDDVIYVKYLWYT